MDMTSGGTLDDLWAPLMGDRWEDSMVRLSGLAMVTSLGQRLVEKMDGRMVMTMARSKDYTMGDHLDKMSADQTVTVMDMHSE